MTSIPVPKEWPDIIGATYTPLRVLGQGGFGSVVLAKRKPVEQGHVPGVEGKSPVNGNSNDNEIVAIKVAGNATYGVTASELAYGHREIDILQAISHPHIMKCFDYVNPTPGKGLVMIMSYHKGPTVEALLRHGGALSTIFGRVVIAQLVDAISFLHCHAVIHRDIKPDNVIVTGALSKQPEVWDNPEDLYDNDSDDDHPHSDNDPGLLAATKESPNWPVLMKQWHVTLIDFGFARALTPEDVHNPSVQVQRENMDASYHQTKYNLDVSLGHSSTLGNSMGASTTSKSRKSLNRSISKMLHRQMSALGTSSYAAPEITQGIHHVETTKSTSITPTTTTNTTIATDDITNTISSFVADYGLLVDAYSLGCTIRYMMTGCPPHQNVAEAIANQNSILTKLWELCCTKKNSTADNKTKTLVRKPCFRLVADLPGEVQRLIMKLTEPKESNRTSVRSARRYPWIQDVLSSTPSSSDDDHDNEYDMFDTGPESIQYLPFAIHHQNNTINTTTTTTTTTTDTSSSPTSTTPLKQQPEMEQPLVST